MERRVERGDNGEFDWSNRYRWSEIHYLGDQMDGLWTVFRNDGSKDWEREMVAGKQHGYERTWAADGTLLDEKWYRDGELHGVWRIWDASGTLRQESHFSKGEQHGPQSWWDENGVLIAQGEVYDDHYHGTFVAEVLNKAETATKRMVLEYDNGELLTDLHWE